MSNVQSNTPDAIAHRLIELAMEDKDMMKFLINHESGKPMQTTKLQTEKDENNPGFYNPNKIIRAMDKKIKQPILELSWKVSV